jgi:hypothetical protein
MAAQFVSILLLIGIIFAYHAGGSLSIDDLAAMPPGLMQGASLAFFLIFIAVVIELKPFPANGWALDIYESAHPAFSAMFSAASGAAVLFAADKVLVDRRARLAARGHRARHLSPSWARTCSRCRRTTTAACSVIPRSARWAWCWSWSGSRTFSVTATCSSPAAYCSRTRWPRPACTGCPAWWPSAISRPGPCCVDIPLLIFAFVTFVAMLLGLPPFPGFYAKWELAHLLAADGRVLLLGLILFASLMEAGYLFRWFGRIMGRRAGRRAARPRPGSSGWWSWRRCWPAGCSAWPGASCRGYGNLL